jgi:DNA-binding response OmpR family regulator
MVSTPRVLVVDDDPDFLEMVEERLSRDDRFEIFAEGSAREALSTLEDRPIDCVVTDSLELEPGTPLVRAVREREPELPLIYYTGKDWSDVADSAVSAGVSDYVQKGTGSVAEVARRVDVLVETGGDGTGVVPAEATLDDGGFGFAPLDESGEDWELVGVFDPEADVDLDVLVADCVADHLDRSVESFTLYDGVDVDALETLVLPRDDGDVREGVTVRFPVEDRLVAVRSVGEIAVRDRPLSE